MLKILITNFTYILTIKIILYREYNMKVSAFRKKSTKNRAVATALFFIIYVW